MRQLLEPRPWWRLQPDTDHKLVVAGYGTWKKADYVTASLADDGNFAPAYVPSPRALTVDLGELRGAMQARWFDPTNAKWHPVEGGPFPRSGKHDFAPPGKNAAGEADWVLLLEVE